MAVRQICRAMSIDQVKLYAAPTGLKSAVRAGVTPDKTSVVRGWSLGGEQGEAEVAARVCHCPFALGLPQLALRRLLEPRSVRP